MKGRQIATYGAATILGAVLILPMSVPLAVGGEPAKECSGPTCSGACAVTADDSAERERLGALVDRQRDELVNLTRTMAAEKVRQTQLESELAAARAEVHPVVAQAPVDAAAPANAGALAEENRRLRLQLDVEREDNEKLAAKLRAASRVADIVFRGEKEQLAAADEADSDDDAVAPQKPSSAPRLHGAIVHDPSVAAAEPLVVEQNLTVNAAPARVVAPVPSKDQVPPGWRLSDIQH